LIKDLGKDTIRAHYRKFHLVTCPHQANAGFGFQGGRLDNNPLLEIAGNLNNGSHQGHGLYVDDSDKS
jgi:hypothetical protein